MLSVVVFRTSIKITAFVCILYTRFRIRHLGVFQELANVETLGETRTQLSSDLTVMNE